MIKIIMLALIIAIFTVSMLFGIEAVIKLGKELELEGTHNISYITTMLVSLVSMGVCTVLAYISEYKEILSDHSEVSANQLKLSKKQLEDLKSVIF
jgi:hypothetical protein